MTNKGKIEKCRKLVSIANTDKAISILTEVCKKDYRDETIMISNRWEDLNNQFIVNTIAQSEFELERNKINKSILILLSKVEELHEVEVPEKETGEGTEKFLDEVERIYRLLGAKTLYKKTQIKNQYIPLIVSFSNGPFTFNTIVDVNSDKNLKVSKEKINELIIKFQTARESGKADKGVFISKSEFTSEAKSIASLHNLTCIKIDELYNQLVYFDDFVEVSLNNFENSNLYNFYINQKGSDVEDYFALTPSEKKEYIHYPLTKYINGLFFEKGERQIAVLGNFGTGKTSLCHKLVNELLKKYKSDPRNRIPVLISLKDYRAGIDIEQLIVSQLQKQPGINIDVKLFGELQKMGRFVFVLDGLDEMATKVDRIVINENLREISRLKESGDNLYLITCRTHFFQDRITDEFLKDYQVIYLTDWGRSELEQYMRKRFPSKWKKYYNQIITKITLEELAKTPMLLEMIVKSLSSFSDDKELNNRNLYKTYTNDWIESQSRRKGSVMTMNQRREFVERIAEHLYIEDESSIHFSELYEIAKDISGYIDATRIDYFDTDARTSTFITKDSSGNYGFYHRSFLEFFSAEIITNEICQNTPNLISSKIIQNEVLDFLDYEKIKENGIKYLKEWSTIFKEKNLSRNAVQILLKLDVEIDREAEEYFGFEKSEWDSLENAVLKDDEVAFSKFINKYYNTLSLYTKSIIGRYGDVGSFSSDDSSDDVIQELFIKLWTRMKEGRIDTKQNLNMEGYLYSMLKFIIINKRRLEAKHQHISLDAFDESKLFSVIDDFTIDEKLKVQETWGEINFILENLNITDNTKKAFILRFKDNCDYQAIADQLNEDVTTVRAKVNRTRIRVIEKFKNEG